MRIALVLVTTIVLLFFHNVYGILNSVSIHKIFINIADLIILKQTLLLIVTGLFGIYLLSEKHLCYWSADNWGFPLASGIGRGRGQPIIGAPGTDNKSGDLSQ